MLTSLKKRIERDEDGFTLIELMVVVLIIAILIAIAIPTFLGARERAQDRAIQSDLRNAFTAEKVVYTDDQAYTADATVLNGIEPSLTFGSGVSAPADNDTINVAIDTNGTVVCLTGTSASGSVFAIADVATGTNAGTYYFDAAMSACSEAAASAGASEW